MHSINPRQAQVWIEQTRGGRLLRQIMWVAAGLLLAGLIAALLKPGAISIGAWLGRWLGWLILLGLLAAAWTMVIYQRRTARLLSRAGEAVQLEQWDQAERELKRLLRRGIRPPTARAEVLLWAAALAEHHHRYDAVQVLLEAVVNEPIGSARQQFEASVGLAAALFRNEQLSDAVQWISRLRRRELPEAMRAAVEAVALLGELLMGQHASAAEAAETRRALFRRHLSTAAGYSYGLMAAAFDRLGQQQRAAEFWHDATLLIEPARLVHRVAELADLAERYRPAERPL
ncbi:MAG: hypothetical protein ACE5K7_04745 [Phycisphaerae bacterium]